MVMLRGSHLGKVGEIGNHELQHFIPRSAMFMKKTKMVLKHENSTWAFHWFGIGAISIDMGFVKL